MYIMSFIDREGGHYSFTHESFVAAKAELRETMSSLGVGCGYIRDTRTKGHVVITGNGTLFHRCTNNFCFFL